MKTKCNLKVAVIGAGFSGLVAASLLAQKGCTVNVFEKNDQPGGRCNYWAKDGFYFDMGPSWYWMPDVFEKFFARFHQKPEDFFELIRLDPSYKVFFDNEEWNIPANYQALRTLFENKEAGSAEKLDHFLQESKEKYQLSMNDLVYKPSLSWTEFIQQKTILGALKYHLFSSFSTYIKKYFSNPKIISLLEFPILFLGAKPENTPSLYSIMNYADIKLGTWYPMGGMFELAKAIEKVAVQQGVNIHYQSPVEKIITHENSAKSLMVNGKLESFDVVISSADYEFTESMLLDEEDRNYTPKYWEKKQMSPSCLLFYWGIDKKIPNLEHHNLFFDEDFQQHAKAIYDTQEAPENPLFYVCCPSKTDSKVAPEGKENLFVLIPISAGLELSDEDIDQYRNMILKRLESRTNSKISEHIILERTFHTPDFIDRYHSFKGNAYGLANTLMQTAVFRPSIKNKKLKNLYYCGQLSVPGPGMPPAIISGTIVADYIIKQYLKNSNYEKAV